MMTKLRSIECRHATTKKILVVDDDKAVTTLLEELLSGQGYTVMVAHDGLDGMVQVRKNVPDLISWIS